MAASDVPVTPGSGANIATYSFTESALTKQLQRVDVNDSAGAEIMGLRSDPSSPITDSLATPSGVTTATSTTGGTLAAGTYYYRVSAINSVGETLAAAEVSQVTTGATSTVTVSWSAVTGATGYNVYGRSTGGELFIATTASLSYVDTGSITPSGALPTVNTTASSSLTSVLKQISKSVQGVSTYGTAPGAVAAIPVNAYVTNTEPSGAAIVANSSPVSPSNKPPGAANFATAQASVGTSATSILAARTGIYGTGRVSATIVNGSTTAVYLGGSGVTTTTGVLLDGVVGASVTIDTQAAIYGIVATGTAAVSAFETY